MSEKTAIQFFKEIKSEQNKYRLINGLFIVKYIDNEISYFIGEFTRALSPLNNNKTNKVRINPTNQKFNKKKNLVTNARGDIWRPLSIKLNEQPIKEILR